MKQAIKGTVAAGRMRAFGVDDAAVLRGLARARGLCDKGNSREAIKTIDKVLEEWPNLGQEIKCGIYVLKSVCMAKVGDAWSALQFAEHAVQQDSESVRAQQRRSAAQMALGRPSNAILGLFKSLQKEPTSSRLRADFDTCQSQIKRDRPFRNEITRHATEYPPANHDGKPQVIVVKKEEPPELAPLDEEWKSLDIMDIMQEQSLLKTAIEQAIQDGDVDKKELELIMRYLRRACVPEETQNIIRTALEDGDMDEDDRKALESICPPSPPEDWRSILELLELEQGYLKTVFRYYCMEGSVGKEAAGAMTLLQFSKFSQAAKIPAKGRVDLGQVDRIFLRANQDRSEGIQEILKKKDKKKKKEVVNKDNELVVHEFVAALIRLAHARYREHPSISRRLETLINVNLKTYAMAGALDDTFTERMAEPASQLVLQEHRDKNVTIFNAACASDTTIGSDDNDTTMSLQEWLALCKATQLITADFTIREARQMFVQVNLDDELYVQEDEQNSADELVFDEFEECLCRAALELYPETDTDDFASCIRSFFEVFVPAALKKVKK